jgi:hypothetical protein
MAVPARPREKVALQGIYFGWATRIRTVPLVVVAVRRPYSPQSKAGGNMILMLMGPPRGSQSAFHIRGAVCQIVVLEAGAKGRVVKRGEVQKVGQGGGIALGAGPV